MVMEDDNVNWIIEIRMKRVFLINQIITTFYEEKSITVVRIYFISFYWWFSWLFNNQKRVKKFSQHSPNSKKEKNYTLYLFKISIAKGFHHIISFSSSFNSSYHFRFSWLLGRDLFKQKKIELQREGWVDTEYCSDFINMLICGEKSNL